MWQVASQALGSLPHVAAHETKITSVIARDECHVIVGEPSTASGRMSDSVVLSMDATTLNPTNAFVQSELVGPPGIEPGTP
jgi:hypothetical protein